MGNSHDGAELVAEPDIGRLPAFASFTVTCRFFCRLEHRRRNSVLCSTHLPGRRGRYMMLSAHTAWGIKANRLSISKLKHLGRKRVAELAVFAGWELDGAMRCRKLNYGSKGDGLLCNPVLIFACIRATSLSSCAVAGSRCFTHSLG